MDFLSVRDDAFERAKAQALCLMPDLDVTRMGFFKTVVDGKMVDMEDDSPEIESLKDPMMDNPTSEAQEDNHHEL